LKQIEGTITALITPFTKDGSAVDFDGLTHLIERQIAAGVSGILPLGTTGETPTLSPEEKTHVIKHAVAVASGRVPVMVGTGTNCTTSTIVATRQAEDLGADSALVVSPYYNKPSQEGLYAHFKAVTASTNIPLVVYNVAPRTAVNIETSTMKRIAELPSVVAVKEASGNIHQIARVIDEVQNQSDSFSVLSGDDSMTFATMMLGGTGVISVASNLIPEHVVALVECFKNGDYVAARKKHFYLSKLFETLFIETNPVPTKSAFALCGFPAGPVRLPLAPLTAEHLNILTQVLAEYELIN
jgi:4-hydroxy-tetrahydrodipicolinate synthase